MTHCQRKCRETFTTLIVIQLLFYLQQKHWVLMASGDIRMSPVWLFVGVLMNRQIHFCSLLFLQQSENQVICGQSVSSAILLFVFRQEKDSKDEVAKAEKELEEIRKVIEESGGKLSNRLLHCDVRPHCDTQDFIYSGWHIHDCMLYEKHWKVALSWEDIHAFIVIREYVLSVILCCMFNNNSQFWYWKGILFSRLYTFHLSCSWSLQGESLMAQRLWQSWTLQTHQWEVRGTALELIVLIEQ